MTSYLLTHHMLPKDSTTLSWKPFMPVDWMTTTLRTVKKSSAVYFHILSDVIDSFYQGVYGFLRQIHACGTDLASTEGATESDERACEAIIDNALARSRTPESEFADTLEIAHEHGLQDGKTFEPPLAHDPCTWLGVEDSHTARDDASPVNSVEEDLFSDNEGRNAISPAQDSDWSGSACSEPPSEPSGIPATEVRGPDATGANERMDIDDASNVGDRPGTVRVETSIQSEQDEQNAETFDDSDDEEGRSANGEEQVSDTNDKLGNQGRPKRTDQAAKKKRSATNGELQRKKPRTSRTEEPTRTPDSTQVPRLPLVDFPALPHGTIQPRNVYIMLQDRCRGQPHEDVLFLTRLFFSLGSPSSVAQLKDAVLMIRRQTDSRTQNDLSEIAHISRWLDQTELSAPLRRRYGLVRSLQRRRELETRHNNQNGIRRSSRKRKLVRHDSSRYDQDDGVICLTTTKANEAALRDLVEECYPYLHAPVRGLPDPQDYEFIRQKNQIQYRLGAARKYTSLQEAVSIGAVALIPIDGIPVSRYVIYLSFTGTPLTSVCRLERLSEKVFTTFLEVLAEKRGSFLRSLTGTLSGHISDLLWQGGDTGYRYKFEGMERRRLAQTAFDTAGLISACQFE